MSGADAGSCLSKRHRNQYYQGDVWPLRGKKHLFIFFEMLNFVVGCLQKRKNGARAKQEMFASCRPYQTRYNFVRKRITRSSTIQIAANILKTALPE